MRFKCWPQPQEIRWAKREQRLNEEVKFAKTPHRHFCLLPVKMQSGECAWLEFVIEQFPKARVITKKSIYWETPNLFYQTPCKPYIFLGKPVYTDLV